MKEFFIKNKVIIFIALFFTFLAWRNYFGLETVGSFFEKTETYYTQYLMKVSSESGKSYKIVGKIQRPSGECYDEGGGCWRDTWVEEIYWSSGKKTTFSDCELENENESGCIDNEGRYWMIELLRPN